MRFEFLWPYKLFSFLFLGMAGRNENEDRTQAPKSRPRPEVHRPIIPTPGGLPMPPQRQQNVPESGASPLTQMQHVTQPGRTVLPPSQQQIFREPRELPFSPTRQQSVPSSSSAIRRFGPITPNIPAPITVPRLSENPQCGTMPTDLFGLPDFGFSFASTPKTEFGLSGTGFSSIKSPTHLPKLANIKVPYLFGSHATRSGILSSNLPSAIKLPMPPNIRTSQDWTSKDLPGIRSDSNTSIAKDLSKRAKRPIDLPLFNVTSTNLSSDPHSSDIPGTSSNNFPSSRTSKELHKPSNTTRTSDRSTESNTPSVSTSHILRSSAAESNPDSRNLLGTSAINITSTSASVPLPGPSSTLASSETHDPQGKIDIKRSSDPTPVGLPGPSEIKRTGDSMPSIAQHPDVLQKSKSMYDKLKRSVRKRLNLKKTRVGPEDKEESTGLVFERDEDEQELRPQPRIQEPEKKYTPFPTDTYNYFWAIDPILPFKEVEKKCYVTGNVEISSPTESMISDTSTSKSEPEKDSIHSSASQVPDPLSRSIPTSPVSEQRSTTNSASETPEPESSNFIPETTETASTNIPIPEISETVSTRPPVPIISESASMSNHIAETLESSSKITSNP